MLRLNQNETIPIFVSKIGVLNNNNGEVGMNGYLPPPPKIKQKRTFMSFTILLSSKSNSTRLCFKYTVQPIFCNIWQLIFVQNFKMY